MMLPEQRSHSLFVVKPIPMSNRLTVESGRLLLHGASPPLNAIGHLTLPSRIHGRGDLQAMGANESELATCLGTRIFQTPESLSGNR
jgi:hypothetical protein